MSKRKIGPAANLKAVANFKINTNLGVVSVKMAQDAPKALADDMKMIAATLRDGMKGRSVSGITIACNRNCQTFCGLLSYHAHPQELPKVGFKYGAPYWELKPGFKEMVRGLGEIQEELARVTRAWDKLPEGKKDKKSFDLYEAGKNHALARNRAWLVRFAPLRLVFLPPADERPPFFYFPWSFQNKDDARLVGEFLYELSVSRHYTQEGGASRGTRDWALSIPEQKLAEKIRGKGKGTERGSIRFIAEELRERGNRKKMSAITQNLKRHFRRIRHK